MTEHSNLGAILPRNEDALQFAGPKTSHSFNDVYHPPEVEELGFTKILKPHGYDFICEEHTKC